jgi:hypothetical protein
MSFVSYSAHEINCKVVYYGPGHSGKTAHLTHIYKKSNPVGRGKLISLATENERTIFFDFLPLNIGKLRGMQVRMHLYTVPGQVLYDSIRKLILRGVDGVVFVADSQPDRREANLETLENLRANLKEHAYDIGTIPLTLVYNKRDLPGVLSIPEMDQDLNFRQVKAFASSAVSGEGVFETLKDISKQVVTELKKQTP